MKKETEPIPQIEGYVPVQRTISILAANIWALVLIALAYVPGWLAMGKPSLHTLYQVDEPTHTLVNLLWLSLMLVGGIVIHELVHGLTWTLLLRKGFSHLSFGMISGAAYCHIDVPMSKRHYVIGALMPLLLVGVVPWVAGIAAGSLLWMFVGSIFIGGASGDLMIVHALRHDPPDAMVYDHPTVGGCYVYQPNT